MCDLTCSGSSHKSKGAEPDRTALPNNCDEQIAVSERLDLHRLLAVIVRKGSCCFGQWKGHAEHAKAAVGRRSLTLLEGENAVGM